MDDQFTDLGRTGERHLIDVEMSGQSGPGRFAVPGDDVDDACGNPAFSISSPSRRAERGVCSAGLSTTVQPAASAGPSFQAAISSGKFHGIIWPTTPTGSRRV